MSERAELLSVYSCSHSRQLQLARMAKKMETAECKMDESRCALCTERFRARHTHPSQWSCELQQFLHQYSSIDMTRCVCRPCYSDLRRGLRGKYPVGQAFIPRWQVREEKKKGRQNPLCCIPGCTTKSLCKYRFATFDTICNAVEVSASILVPCKNAFTGHFRYVH